MGLYRHRAGGGAQPAGLQPQRSESQPPVPVSLEEVFSLSLSFLVKWGLRSQLAGFRKEPEELWELRGQARMGRGGAPCSIWEGVFLGLGTRQCPWPSTWKGQSVCTSHSEVAVAGNPLSITSKPEYTAGASYMLVTRHCFSQIDQLRSSSQSQGAWVRILGSVPPAHSPWDPGRHTPHPSTSGAQRGHL